MNTLTSSRSFRTSDTAVEFFPKNGENLNLRNVWEGNLVEEMEVLMKAVEIYPYIAMVKISLFFFHGIGHGVSWSLLHCKG